MRKLVAFTAMFLPGPLKRAALTRLLGFKLAPGASIGLSFVLPDHLEMGPGSRIGHFNVVKGLAKVRLEAGAVVGNFNWITGFPLGDSVHFSHMRDRAPEFVVEREASVTNRHVIDCTDRVVIGAFSTFAGFRSQILTHSINLTTSRQECAPVTVGGHCFVGTGSILLPGSALPPRSVLGAGAVLNRAHVEPGLYAGVPAKRIREVGGDYFTRTRGFVE